MGATSDRIKGKAKQIEGKLTGDKVRATQGKAQEAKGDLEAAASRAVRRTKGRIDQAATRTKAELDRASRSRRKR